MPRFMPSQQMVAARDTYLEWLSQQIPADLGALWPQAHAIDARSLYVPLLLSEKRISDEAKEETITRAGRSLSHWLDTNRILLISGPAGSGKTALLHALLASLCRRADDELCRRLAHHLPILLPTSQTPWGELTSLDDWVGYGLRRFADATTGTAADLEPYLEARHGLLLVDGLEAVDEKHRLRVLGWLRQHRWIVGAEPNFTVLTARDGVFEACGPEAGPPGRHLHLAPWTSWQVRRYLDLWSQHRPCELEHRQQGPEVVVRRLLDRSRGLLALARRPAHLVSAIRAYGTAGRLATDRASLFEQWLDSHLEVLEWRPAAHAPRSSTGSGWARPRLMEILAELAHAACRAEEERDPRDGRMTWTRAELAAQLRAMLAGADDPTPSERLSEHLLHRTGIFETRGDGHLRFGHPDFQSFLAARYLSSREDADIVREIFAHLAQPGWTKIVAWLLAIDPARPLGARLLADLDPRRKHDFDLLVAVLTLPEMPLPAIDRRAWLAAWFAATAATGDLDSVAEVVAEEANRALLDRAWLDVCRAAADDIFPLEALASLVVAATGRQWARAEPSSFAAPAAPPAICEHIQSAIGGAKNQPTCEVHALLLPLYGGHIPATAEAALLPVVERRALFAAEPGASWKLSATPLWRMADRWAWSSSMPRLSLSLAEKTPLIWWLVADDFVFRTLLDLRVATTSTSTSTMVRWRERVWWLCMQMERLFLIAGLGGRFAIDSTDSRLLASLDDCRYGARFPSRDGTASDHRLQEDLDSASDLARFLDRTLELLAVDRLDHDLRLDFTATVRRLTRRQLWQAAPAAWREQVFWTLGCASQALALSRGLTMAQAPGDDQPALPSLADLASDRTMTRGLSDPVIRAQASEEWRLVLASALSPLPLLERIRAGRWQDLDSSSQAIVAGLVWQAEELLKVADTFIE